MLSGPASLTSGNSDGASGGVRVASGTVSVTGTTTGQVLIESGLPITDSGSGDVLLRSAAVTTSGGVITSGEVQITTGSGDSNCVTGEINIITGTSVDNNAGNVNIKSGDVTGTGNGGNITLQTGAVNETSGSIFLVTGAGDTTGDITLEIGNAGSTNGSIRFVDTSLSTATNNAFWTLIDQTTGRGEWQNSVNQNLLPAINGSFSLGSSSFIWSALHTTQIIGTSGLDILTDGNGDINLMSNTTGVTRLQFFDNDASNSAGIKAPAVLSADYTLTLPPDDGENEYLLSTNGSGVLSFRQVDSPSDIQETSFSAANNQVAAADVTGFNFPNANVRSFTAIVSVAIDATADLFAIHDLMGIQASGGWQVQEISVVGDADNIVFSITSAGQIQYTSGNEAGFVSNAIKFRAITTST